MTMEHELPVDHPEAADERPANTPFPVVGVGASAGGLEAYGQLLTHLPPDTGMAFVLVQHLDPTYENKLAFLLAKATRMPVADATDGLAVEPNHVYVIPKNTTMTIARGALRLVPRGEARSPHLPIDAFLKSLADDQRSAAVAVILSGTGTDGTLGLLEVKAAGGITFAQDRESAKFAAMPESAAASGTVDFVLPPEGIARELVRIGNHPYLAPSEIPKGDPAAAGEEEAFRKVITLLRSAFGVDFTHYRDTTIRRRTRRRMAVHAKATLADYARLLDADRAEVETLYHDILINVTSFFRDPEMFETLKTSVFPEIVRAKTAQTPVRVWTAGCSTGQEAYSIAIALSEFLDDRPVRPPIQIFATDLSDAVSLEKARMGLYPESIEGEVSPERLRRFFTKEDGKYRVSKTLRDLCVFAKQNIAVDPPFSRVDLISCRNVLIYLASPLQKRIIPTFHYALNPTGYLMLGSSETVGGFADLFDVVDKTHRIYAKKPSPIRQYPHFFAAEGYSAGGPAGSPSIVSHAPTAADYQKEADRIVLGQFAPVGVLVNDNFEVLQYRGRTSPYLEAPPGEPSVSLLKLVREGLFVEVKAALAEAKKEKATVEKFGVRVRDGDRTREVNFKVVPVKPAGTDTPCYLVLFEDARPATGHEATEDRRAASWFSWAFASPRPAADTRAERDRELPQLRRELATAREQQQLNAEQNDASNEELRSANEEILSSNEELQSTNEELQTAKEELQSVNEELTTVNEQLQNRNLELGLSNNDLTNLIGSAAIPVVMLGSDLRIRRFTPSANKVLNLLPTDVGRPIGNIKPTVDVPDLEELLLDVIATVQVREREVQDRDGRWYHLRLHPYRTADNRIDGAVVVLFDINDRKRSEDALRRSEEKYRSLFNSMDQGYCIIQMLYEGGQPVDWLYVEVNPAFEKHNGLPNATGRTMREMAPTIEQKWMQIYGRVAETGKSIRLEEDSPTLDGRAFDLYAFRVGDAGERKVAVLFTDITERKRRERNLAFLADIESRFASLTSPEEIAKIAGDSIGEHFNISHCLLVDINEQMSVASVFHDHRATAELPSLVGDYVLENFHSAAEIQQLTAGQPVVVNDVLDERHPPVSGAKFHALGTRAFVTAPYVREGRWKFALGVQVNQPRQWREEETAFLTELASRIGLRMERARVETALSESEKKYRSLFDSMDQGHCIFQMLYEDDVPVNWRYIATNSAFEKHTGMYNAVGRTILDMAPSIERKWIEVYARVAETGESTQFEESSLAFDGDMFCCNAFSLGRLEEHKVAVLFTNITERKRVETALRESEERQAFLLKLSDALRPLSDPSEVQREVTRMLGEHLGVELAYYSEIDTAAGSVDVLDCYTRGDSPSLEGGDRLADFGWIVPAMQGGEILRISDVPASPLVPDAEQPTMAAVRIGAIVAVPLIRGGVLVGGLCVADHAPRSWTDAEVELVREVADRVWAAVERARAEVALRASEEKYRTLFDAMTEGVAVCDLIRDADGRVIDWRFVQINQAWERQTGVGRAAAIGLTAGAIFPGLEPFWGETITRVVDSGEPEQIEYYAKLVDRWYHASIYARGPEQFVIVYDDISGRKRIEEALRHADERLQVALSAARLGVWTWDVERDIHARDAKLSRMLGLPEIETADTVESFYALIHAADRDQVRAVFNAAVEGGGSFAVEFRVAQADGSTRWLRDQGDVVFGTNGTATQLAGACVDVTDRKRVEEERTESQKTLFTLIERCPFGIFIVDADFRIVSVNAGSHDKTFINVRPIIGRPFDEAMRIMWPEPLAVEVIQMFRHTLATGEPYNSTDFVSIRADTGVTEGYEWELHRLTLPGGRYGVVCYYFDATKLRHAEQELRDADRRKDVFLATLAHELRNPLAPIRNGLQVMRMAGASGTIEEARSMMDRQVTQLVRLVDDLLDVSRVTSGKLELRTARIELRAVIDAAVETSRPVIEHAGHELSLVVPDEPIFVVGDVTRLAQVVSNLLNNSAKYTHRGGHVRLKVERDGETVMVSVKDDGIGIPFTMLGRVFEMFTQVDRTLEKTTGGLGIGLSLVKGLVEMHGGTIEARSDGEGMGSEFVVRLSVVPPDSGTADPSDGRAEEIVTPGLRRILVVDDNTDSADSLGKLLKMLGNEVRTAYDGEAAVQRAGEFRPAVMFCDIGMPKVNGYEAARRIREQPWSRDMVMVALTGWGREDDRKKSSDAGFDFHLVKPIDMNALMKLLAGLGQDDVPVVVEG